MLVKLRYKLVQNLSFLKHRLLFILCHILYVNQDKFVIFESFHGKRYADSPRAIYEEMISNDKYRDFTYIWAFEHPEQYDFLTDNIHTIVIKKGSFSYLKFYAASRFWINNVSVPDYLKPSKKQIYIETWHGVPLKKIGCDITVDTDPRQSLDRMHSRYKKKGLKATHFLTCSQYYTDKITSAFGLKNAPEEKFIKSGLPRNERLISPDPDEINSIREKLSIPPSKKVILYAPTWRDTDYDSKNNTFNYNPGVDFDKLLRMLPSEYIILFRAHHQTGLKDVIKSNDRLIDVTSYDNINDIFLVSNMLITDYSSVMFDYSLLKRPIIYHMYDKDIYENDIRGFYIDTEELPGPITTDTEELATTILNLDKNFSYENDQKYIAFNKKHHTWDCKDSSMLVIDNYINIPPHKKNIREYVILFTKKNLNRMKIVYMIIKYNITGFFYKHGLFMDNNTRRLLAMKDSHKGERCFLIGNGPSLTPEDLHLLKNEYTFGTNMIYKIYDKTDWRPSFHCVSDSIYATKLRDEIYNNVKSPIFTIEKTYHKMTKRNLHTTYVHTIASERYKVRGNLFAYCMVKATVLSLAAEFAFHMGFSEIYLLGVDCTNPHAKGGHFTENYTTKEIAETDISRIKNRMNKENVTTQQIGEHIIDRSLVVYKLLKEHADKHGIKIYNATRGGNLEIFPRVKLEDVLAKENGGK